MAAPIAIQFTKIQIQVTLKRVFLNHTTASVRAIEKMPSPDTLTVGDRVRFIALPDEWNEPSYGIHRDSVSFMKRMLKRATPVRVTMIDEFGTPWIDAVTIERGKRHYHSWAITEETGWRKVVPRKRRKAKTD